MEELPNILLKFVTDQFPDMNEKTRKYVIIGMVVCAALLVVGFFIIRKNGETSGQSIKKAAAKGSKSNTEQDNNSTGES